MASKQENSFGARLRALENATEILSLWPDYAPAAADIKIPNLKAFIASVVIANQTETVSQALYKKQVAKRQALYSGKSNSLTSHLSQIRGAVSELYGRRSAELQSVASIISILRETRLIVLPKDPANPDLEKTVSQSQQSFGSRAQYFDDLVTTLSTFNGYTSAKPETQLGPLQLMIQQIREANNEVAACIGSLQSTRSSRTGLYNQMVALGERIKDNAKSTWSVSSSQYKTLVALGI